MSSRLQALITRIVINRRIFNYVNSASLVLFAADYLQTVDLEVSLIWRTEWTLIKVLYFVSRYMPFIDNPIPAAVEISIPLSLKGCKTLYGIAFTAGVMGTVVAEAILFIRLYALSGRNRMMGIFLWFQFITVHTTLLVLQAKYVSTIVFAPSPIPSYLPCFPIQTEDALLTSVFALLLGSEALVMIISIWVGISKYRGSQGPLIKVFYRDGIFYFVCLALVSLGNIVIRYSAPKEYRYVLAMPQRMIHSILSTRMVLHLRQTGQEQIGFKTGKAEVTGIQFAPRRWKREDEWDCEGPSTLEQSTEPSTEANLTSERSFT